MHRVQAEKVVELVDLASTRLGEALVIAEQHFSREDFESFRTAIASILVELRADALRCIHARYADLDPHGYSLRT